MPSDDTDHPPLAPGYHALAPGHIANLVTYLEMTARPRAKPAPVANAAYRLDQLAADDPGGYRALFRAVGEPWLWTSRLAMSDAELRAILSDPRVEAYALTLRADRIGLLELDFRQAGACELAFFGVTPNAIGRGAGRHLMTQAIAKAWARPIARFWLHTCTFDSPRAIDFYRGSGFVPYKQAVEVMADPRLAGLVPRAAAPHVMLLPAS